MTVGSGAGNRLSGLDPESICIGDKFGMSVIILIDSGSGAGMTVGSGAETTFVRQAVFF